MATYKFSQFNVELTNPTVDVIGVVDSINEKTCSVNVVLTTDSVTFGINFSGFTYTDTWTDEEIIFWVNNVELKKYEI
jgi:hypothetical protein